jgi:hypothetical protein
VSGANDREPSGARWLLRQRWAGRHIDQVVVLYSRTWSQPAPGEHRLFVRSSSWQAGALDWRCVTDLRVRVVDDDPTFAPDGWPWSLHLAAEICDCAAVVHLVTPIELYDDGRRFVDPQQLAWECIEAGETPSWWPARRSVTHDVRRDRFRAREAVRRGWDRRPDVRAGLPR